MWDELYGRLAGRATVAYVDLERGRATQKRFRVFHNDLPAIFYISKGKYYRYRVIKDELDTITPLLNIDNLETFVVNREYDDIPNALPEDHGEIPFPPSFMDIAREYIDREMHQGGGISSILFLKGADGESNYAVAFAVWLSIALVIVSAGFVLREAYNEIFADDYVTPKKR